jgi:acetyl/propionyl-CoA carboxylase alpha subunit
MFLQANMIILPDLSGLRCLWACQMERSAQRLTQNIGYIGAGTVEYLYNAATKTYFFLELNPRLQVCHLRVTHRLPRQPPCVTQL